MHSRILIIGSGISALSCARLLAEHGLEVTIYGKMPPPKTPILVLNNVTYNLIKTIWRENYLFEGSYIVSERRLLVGKENEESIIKQSSTIIESDILTKRLLYSLMKTYDTIKVESRTKNQYLEKVIADSLADSNSNKKVFDWIIDASGRSSYLSKTFGIYERQSFGHRCIINKMACLRNEIGRETCWMEIVSDGWVFMTPLGKNRALLQAMVPQRFDNPLITFMHLVSQTQAIKHRISTFEDPTTYQEAFPEISNPLCGQGWILAGDSAVSFDPLSGNGTGYALKGAILLVAVINAIVSGFPLSRCLAHYTLRLRTEFLSHLKECLGYYSMWFSTPYWKDEVKLMKKAFSQLVMGNEDFIFGLKNFSLEKLHK